MLIWTIHAAPGVLGSTLRHASPFSHPPHHYSGQRAGGNCSLTHQPGWATIIPDADSREGAGSA